MKLATQQIYALCENELRLLRDAPLEQPVARRYAGFALGVYTAFRSYPSGRFLHLSQHLNRLCESAARSDIALALNHNDVRIALSQLSATFAEQSLQFRIDILAQASNGVQVLIAIAPFSTPPLTWYEQGVRVITTQDIARTDPKTKSASFASDRWAVEAMLGSAHEALMLTCEGGVLEGLKSNFYAIENSTLWTADEGVLFGVTRACVLQLAEQQHLSIRYEPFNIAAIDQLDEAALSASSKGIVPIVRIDDRVIGDGKPGRKVNALVEAYGDYVQANLEGPFT